MSTPLSSPRDAAPQKKLDHDIPWVTHALIGTLPLVLGATFYARDKLLFAGHVFAMSAGCVFLTSEGIIVAKNATGKQRGIFLRLHLYIQAASLVLAALGFSFIYSSRSMASKQHFTTWHTWVGLGTLIGFLLVATGGVAIYYGLPKPYKKLKGQLAKIHKLGGKIVFYAGLTAAFLALKVTDPAHHRHKGVWTYILAVWLVFVGFVVQDVAPIDLKLGWLRSSLRTVRSQSFNASEVSKKDDPAESVPEGQAWRFEEQRPALAGGESQTGVEGQV